MELTIFGAAGGTGTSLTGQALAAGHEVTAVVRDPARLSVPHSHRLRVVTADLMDPARSVPRWQAPTRCSPRSGRGARGLPPCCVRAPGA
jgi:nucleoside-diphosphate-sugar epimerase